VGILILGSDSEDVIDFYGGVLETHWKCERF